MIHPDTVQVTDADSVVNPGMDAIPSDDDRLRGFPSDFSIPVQYRSLWDQTQLLIQSSDSGSSSPALYLFCRE